MLHEERKLLLKEMDLKRDEIVKQVLEGMMSRVNLDVPLVVADSDSDEAVENDFNDTSTVINTFKKD